MAGIQSLGTGSGILTSDLLEKLVQAERAPTEKRLEADKALVDTRIAAFAELGGLLETFRSSAAALTLPSSFKIYTAASSNEAAVSASASSVAVPGNYSINASKLAQAQTIASTEYASLDTVLGEGALQFTFGDVDYDSGAPSFAFTPDASKSVGSVVINNSNHTLSGVRDAINNAGLAVAASIVDTGAGYKLLIQSKETGDNNGFRLSVANPSNGLDALEFNSVATQMTQTIEAQNAELTVNGLFMSRASNTLSGVINGVTLNLKQQTVSPVTITIARNSEAIAKKATAFVDAYNELKNAINDYTAFDAETNTGSVLIGDGTVRSIASQLRQAVSKMVVGLSGGNVRALSDVGVTSNGKTGLLEFDARKFQQKLESHADSMTGLFGTLIKSGDSQVKALSVSSKTVPGSYSVNITQLATRSNLVGAATAGQPFVVDADNDNLTIQVDGVLSSALSLSQGNYSGAQLAAELQTKINSNSALVNAGASVEVSYNSGDGSFSIASARYGSSSKVLLFGVDTTTQATLGLTAVGAASGVNLAGSINGVAATGTGQLLKAAVGDDSEGFMVEVTGGSLGDRGLVSYVRGVAEDVDDIITRLKDTSGAFAVKQSGLQKEVSRIAEQREAMEDRLEILRERLAKQFSYNDTLISRLNSTGDYISQQLEILNAMFANKKK